MSRTECYGYLKRFVWWVELPDDEQAQETLNHTDNTGMMSEWEEALRDTIRRQDETIEQLRQQLQSQATAHQQQLEAKDKQISELHVLLQQQTRAIPAPGRSWWRRLWGKS